MNKVLSRVVLFFCTVFLSVSSNIVCSLADPRLELMKAITRDDIAQVSSLFEKNHELLMSFFNQWLCFRTPLVCAVEYNAINCARFLLAIPDLNVNAKNELFFCCDDPNPVPNVSGKTALFLAIEQNNHAMVTSILERKDVNIYQEILCGFNAFLLAAKQGNEVLLEALLLYPSFFEVEKTTLAGKTVVDQAVISEHKNMFANLLTKAVAENNELLIYRIISLLCPSIRSHGYGDLLPADLIFNDLITAAYRKRARQLDLENFIAVKMASLDPLSLKELARLWLISLDLLILKNEINGHSTKTCLGNEK